MRKLYLLIPPVIITALLIIFWPSFTSFTEEGSKEYAYTESEGKESSFTEEEEEGPEVALRSLQGGRGPLS